MAGGASREGGTPVMRVGEALPVAGARIRERLDAGEEPRDDGFSDAELGERKGCASQHADALGE